MKYHTLIFRKFEKMLKKLSSAAVVIGAFMVKHSLVQYILTTFLFLVLKTCLYFFE